MTGHPLPCEGQLCDTRIERQSLVLTDETFKVVTVLQKGIYVRLDEGSVQGVVAK